jgi:hypothetical protein
MLLRSALIGLLFVSAVGCKQRTNNEGGVKQRDESADPLHERFGVRINITTNMATFYENGKAIRQWKVATARDDGRSATPEGKFRFHEMTTCTSWTSTRNGASTGPCAGDNPLGYRGMWFHGSSYGLHGVDDAHISSVIGSDAESRRQSSGCVRNHPSDIKWLTDKAAELYGTTPAELAKNVSSGREKTFYPVSQGLALEVGRWPSDPAVDSSGDSGNEPICTAAKATGFIFSPTELDVVDGAGKKIGVSKPFELVCPTKVTKNDKTHVFFPNEPSGFGWVLTANLRQECKGNSQFASLSKCIETAGNPMFCENLCIPVANNGNTGTGGNNTGRTGTGGQTNVCTDPKIDLLTTHGRSVTLVHGNFDEYHPSAVADALSPRKDGLPFKLSLRHSDSDKSNIAFDSLDNGKTLAGFRYNFAWAPDAKVAISAKWDCNRWVGTMGPEKIVITP